MSVDEALAGRVAEKIMIDVFETRSEFRLPNDTVRAMLKSEVAVIIRAELEAASAWQPIDENTPKDGRTILLGYHNSAGRWRTMRGQWFTEQQIMDEWENGDSEAGWYETSVENDEPPNCWATQPTHWQPLPSPPQASPVKTGE